MTRAWAALMALWVLGACAPTDRVASPSSPQVVAGDPATSAATPATPKAEPSEASAAVTIPAALKHDAFTYGGFSDKPVTQTFEVVMQRGAPEIGTSTLTPVSSDEEGVVFRRERAGALASLGNDEVLLSPKGLEVRSVSLGKISGNLLEMPAKLPQGATWKSEQTLNTGENVIRSESTYRVRGKSKVKVPAGTFDALVIEMSAKVTQDQGTPIRVTATYWHVKERGVVKIELKSRTPGQPEQTVTFALKSTS